MGLRRKGIKERRRKLCHKAVVATLFGIGAALVTILIAATSIVSLWRHAESSAERANRVSLRNLATSLSASVNAEALAQFTKEEQTNTPAYLKVLRPLREAWKRTEGIEYIYVVRQNKGVVEFVLDAAEPGDRDRDGVEDQSPIGQVYDEADPYLTEMVADRGEDAFATDQPYTDRWGTFFSGLAKVKTAKGELAGVIGVDVSASTYLNEKQNRSRTALQGLLVSILLSIAVGIAVGLGRYRSLTDLERVKKQQESLEDRDLRLTLALDAAGLGFWDWDMVSNLVHADETYLRMLGYPPSYADVSATVWQELIHPDDMEVLAYNLSRYLRGESETYGTEVRIRRADGTWCWIDSRGKVIEWSEDGKPLRLVGTHLDITEIKETELANRSQRALLSNFVEHAPAAIAMLDQDGYYLEASDRWYSTFDIARGKLVGQLHAEAFANAPEHWIQAVTECLSGQEVKRDEDLWFLTNWKNPQYLKWEMKPWRRANHELGGVMVFVENTTERVMDEWEIRTQSQQLMELNVQLEEIASRDALTALFNRRQFARELQDAIVDAATSKIATSLLFLDIDDFKFVNDSLGHEAGDLLLKVVADRVRTVLPEDAVAARLGGDEFAVLLPEDPNGDLVRGLANQLLKIVALPVQLGERTYSLGTSIGIAQAADEIHGEELLRRADIAMYHAKSEGKSCYRIYEPWMSENAEKRLDLIADLKHAWNERQFEVFYQPIVDLESAEPYDVEALIRWKHPERGYISPAEFIPLAEETGLISQIGSWVLEESCRNLVKWKAERPILKELKMGVNVSGVQVRQADFVEMVANVLESTGIRPGDLVIEITETLLMTDAEAPAKLEKLRSLGVLVAIDDFGTGYSSMASLASLPVDIVKIDRSFVTALDSGLEATAILRALVALCRVLGRTVIAEGVETEDQFVRLHALGCQLAQGYRFGKPMCEKDLMAWLGFHHAEIAA